MPRISIDDSLYRDIKFRKLCLKVGCDYKGLGMIITAYTLAQHFYLTESNDRLIPFNEYPEDLQILCEIGIVVKKEKGYYVRGSDDHFAWLLQRSNAGKSKKSKRKISDQQGHNGIERNGTESNETKPITRSITKSRSITNTRSVFKYDPTKLEDRGDTTIHSSKTEILDAGHQGQKKDSLLLEEKELNKKIWEEYKKTYEEKYKVTPIRNAKTNSIINALGKRLGHESVDVVRFFVQHPNSFYITKMHDIACCLSDAESLRTQMIRGKAITKTDIRRYEQAQERFNLRDAIDRGEI